MMDFNVFEVLYGGAITTKNAADKVSPMRVAMSIRETAKTSQELLKKQFIANFPSSLEDAERHPNFDAEQFFTLLQKYPELDVDRKKARAMFEGMAARKMAIPESVRRVIVGYAFNPE